MRHHTFIRLHHTAHAVHFGATAGLLWVTLVLLVLCMAAPATLMHVRATGKAPFAGASYWNVALPRSPAIAANSDQLVAQLHNQVTTFGAGVDNTSMGAAVYAAESGTPPVTVLPGACAGAQQAVLAAQWQAVPVPFFAQPSGAPGARMIIYQQSTQTMWEFGGMYNAGGQWYACSGGRLTNYAASSGVFAPPFGATASGLAQLGGQVSLQDVQSGRIDHAIGLALPQLSAGAVWPAARGVSTASGVNAPVMGTRLQLDPAIDINSLGLSNYGKMVARAAQLYGFVVWDTSASAVTIASEHALSMTARGLPSPYGTVSLANFPWDRLRALPPGYGAAGHLPAISSFASSAQSVKAGQSVQLSWAAQNVNQCTIPGVAGSLAAQGTVQTSTLSESTVFTVSCGGPSGTATRSVAVVVTDKPVGALPTPPQALDITMPVAGGVRLITDLFDERTMQQIYKVAYYERQNLVHITTKAPYDLDTSLLPDGAHVLGARVFFRDGTEQQQQVTLRVQNHAEVVPLGPLSMETPKNRTASVLFAAGTALSLCVMSISAWYGWRRSKATLYWG